MVEATSGAPYTIQRSTYLAWLVRADARDALRDEVPSFLSRAARKKKTFKIPKNGIVIWKISVDPTDGMDLHIDRTQQSQASVQEDFLLSRYSICCLAVA